MEEHGSSSSPLETASSLSAAALRALHERAQAALSASREQTASLEAEITRQLDDIAATLSEQIVAETHGVSEREQHLAEIARLNEELKISRETWCAERVSLEGERDELRRQVEELEARNRVSQDEWRKQLLDFEARLGEQHHSWDEQRLEWTAARTGLERERDELQQKFELALQDFQRLRERVAELEHDLARRPAADQSDSAELVALRAERDALAERARELEERPAAQLDPDVEQQMSDLQRRFELAVEDLREFKTKCAKLETQLAAASTRSPGHSVRQDTGGMDWESQKQRMLASLADDGDDRTDSARQEERVKIKGTIEITDAIVAEKDRRIAELMATAETARNKPADDEEARSQELSDLIDTDEVIVEHRRRGQQLEREAEDKLRAAELELSIERAKMARQKAELEELRSNLESERQLYEASGGPPAPGTPRRRWLSKLGIDGKE